MKSIYRTIVLFAVSFTVVSCNIDFLYIDPSDAHWSIEEGDQRAFLHFSKNGRASILQCNYASGAVQLVNGDYECDGHSVLILDDDGSTYKLTRTFSHLKNSKNKNFSRMGTGDCGELGYSVWTSVLKDNFTLLYLSPEGKQWSYTFKNVTHEEGVPYGWSVRETVYSVAGTHVQLGESSATMFAENLLTDEDVWFFHFPVNENEGSSSLKGSALEYVSSSFPGIILFDTASSFTRVLMANRNTYVVSRGNYTIEGNSVSLTLDGKTEKCEITDGNFTFMERSYKALN